MAAPWTTQRRPQAAPSMIPLAPTPAQPSARAPISLDAWEVKITLDERHTRSINTIKRLCEEKPLPLKFAEEDDCTPFVPGTPNSHLKRALGVGPKIPSRPTTPVVPSSLSTQSKSRHAFHPKQAIQTPQQFHDWFALIERSIQHSQEAHFRAHLSLVSKHLSKCDELLTDVDGMDNQLRGMFAAWRGVEEGGRSLKGASEQLLEEKNRLLDVTEAANARLEYFQELERATRMLNHPGEDLVLQPDFLLMVERVDVCLEFLQSHPQYREAEIYILRFQQCLTRAMTLIKIYFVNSLRILTTDAQSRLAERDVSSTTLTHLLYSRFASVSAQVSPLLSEMERRASSYPDELLSLLAECHTAYLTARRALLGPQIAHEVKGMDPAHSELVELTRMGCGYLKIVCADELTLYRRFFDSGEDKLYRYLEGLCDYLYDHLRPRILQESRITVLCEVCTVLHALVLIGADTVPTPTATAITSSNASSLGDDDEMDRFTSTALPDERPGVVEQQPISRKLNIGQLLQMILQDAQTRLVFKAQSVVKSDIMYHSPQPGELQYPQRITEPSNVGVVTDLVEPSTDDFGFFRIPPLRVQATWYPSLRKTVWLLTHLHQFIKPAIFYDIAQEAISNCRESLDTAAQLVSAQDKESNRSTDGNLFLVRHLLVLKEMTSILETIQQNPGHSRTVGTGALDSLGSVVRGTSLLSPSSLLGGLAGIAMPRRVEASFDARVGVDQDLKRSCEDLINTCTQSATAPIRMFLERPSVGAFPGTAIAQAVEYTEEQAITANATFKETCEREVRVWSSRVKIYLEDERTAGVLWTAVQNRIIGEYALFRGFLGGLYGGEVLRSAYSEGELLDWLRSWYNPV